MSQRFYFARRIDGDRALLEDAEAHHVAHVMRAKAGDEVTLFDGSGCEFAGRIARVARATVDVEIVERREVDRELPFALTIGVALPKGDRQRWLVEKAVELGVTTIVPLITARSIADSSGRSKLDRAVIEASKQCGRNRLMQIASPQRWADWAASLAPAIGLRLFAHTSPLGDNASSDWATAGAVPAAIAIGPEGGWTDDEASLAKSRGWQSVSLGSRILRVETAAIALATLVTQRRFLPTT